MHHVGIAAKPGHVHATLVDGKLQRLRFVFNHRHIYPMGDVEGGVRWVADRLFPDVVCDKWRFYTMDNGASLLVPATFPFYNMRDLPSRGTDGRHVVLSAQAAGIAVSLCVLEWSTRKMEPANSQATRYFLRLLDYLAQHPEVHEIRRVVQAFCLREAASNGGVAWALLPLMQGTQGMPAAHPDPFAVSSKGSVSVHPVLMSPAPAPEIGIWTARGLVAPQQE